MVFSEMTSMCQGSALMIARHGSTLTKMEIWLTTRRRRLSIGLVGVGLGWLGWSDMMSVPTENKFSCFDEALQVSYKDFVDKAACFNISYIFKWFNETCRRLRLLISFIYCLILLLLYAIFNWDSWLFGLGLKAGAGAFCQSQCATLRGKGLKKNWKK